MKFPVALLLLVSVFWIACEQSENPSVATQFETLSQNPTLPNTPFNYANQTLPAHLNIPPILNQDNTPNNNQVTDAGATLGRVLFYDKHLSINNEISCASCHQASAGFSDNSALSRGFDGGMTGRNSMGLANARFYTRGAFFWDERAPSLEDQVLMPIQDEVEMGMTLEELVAKLNQVSYYPDLFEEAFGSPEITSERISLALAQFIRSMLSYQSKYDVGRAQVALNANLANTNFPNFTAQENLGKQVFFDPNLGACAPCHGSDNFVGPEPRNNGLENPVVDLGFGSVTGLAQDNGLFKVGSLRNIALTAPYMHDGRFATLAEVVEHYNSGVQLTPNLSPPLRRPNGTASRLNLSNEQKTALVAFLNTLTDEAFVQDERFSNPFE